MGYYLIILILALGILARSELVMLAASILLILRLLHLESIISFFKDKGISVGLLILMITVLIPLATDQVRFKDLPKLVTSLSGVLAILGCLLATKLNGMGIDLLKVQPELIIGMVLGSIIGIVFWGGVPVGPLMAGGLTALFIKFIGQ